MGAPKTKPPPIQAMLGGAGGHIDDVERDEGVADEAVDQRGHAQSGEERGNFDISDQHAIDHARRQRQQKSQQQGERDRNAGIGEVERPGRGHRVDRDDRQVDAATDHDDRHPDAENAQRGDAAHQREKIARAQEIL